VADAIIYEKKDGVGRIRFNRPEKRNAINEAMLDRFWECVFDAEADETIRVIAISGAGESFSAGGDLEWVAGAEPENPDSYLMDRGARGLVQARIRGASVWDALWTVPKPIVAQVQGYCLGGACEIALFADYVIASEDAKFGEPEAPFGIVSGGLWMLGPKVARELLLLGGTISAAEALNAGLVNKVVARAALDTEAEQVIARLLKLPPESAALVKRTGERFYRALGLFSALDSSHEITAYVRALRYRDPDPL
jgi:enoyl-CoA hydratase